MKGFILIILTAISLLFSSCSNNSEIASVVKEWTDREIKLPKNLYFIFDNDTVDYDITDVDFKILTYIDSLGCVACRMKLPMWNDFLQEISTQRNNQVGVVFVVNTNDIKGIDYILKRDRFKYPVCLDAKDSINILNAFPGNHRFRTFLLDKNNKVIAIGNPILSHSVRKLYLNIIQSRYREQL